MPPCEYFTPFYIQCGVYTEFGIEPQNFYFVFFYDSATVFHGFCSDTSFLFRDRETFFMGESIYKKTPARSYSDRGLEL